MSATNSKLKKLLIILLSIQAFPAYSDSLNKYSVEGAYLGQHSSEFIKTLNLKKSDYSLRTSYVPNTKIVSGQFLELHVKVNKSTINGINFDHEKRLERLSKWRRYAHTPDWKKIKEKLISKYGKPDLDRYGQSGYSYIRMGTRYGLCWGECKKTDFSYGFVQCRDGGACMTVVYHTDLNGEDGPAINQELEDQSRENRSSAFYEKQKKLHAESDF